MKCCLFSIRSRVSFKYSLTFKTRHSAPIFILDTIIIHVHLTSATPEATTISCFCTITAPTGHDPRRIQPLGVPLSWTWGHVHSRYPLGCLQLFTQKIPTTLYALGFMQSFTVDIMLFGSEHVTIHILLLE